jgi:hypothetical protein
VHDGETLNQSLAKDFKRKRMYGEANGEKIREEVSDENRG